MTWIPAGMADEGDAAAVEEKKKRAAASLRGLDEVEKSCQRMHGEKRWPLLERSLLLSVSVPACE